MSQNTNVRTPAGQPTHTAPRAPQPLTPEQLRQVAGGDRARNHNY